MMSPGRYIIPHPDTPRGAALKEKLLKPWIINSPFCAKNVSAVQRKLNGFFFRLCRTGPVGLSGLPVCEKMR
jgi:hypothetical protein